MFYLLLVAFIMAWALVIITFMSIDFKRNEWKEGTLMSKWLGG